MKAAAIGVSVHSGWGVVVAITGAPGKEELLERRRIEVVNRKVRGVAQPYHFAAELPVAEAAVFIRESAARAVDIAIRSLSEFCAGLKTTGHSARAVVLNSSARPLPELQRILRAHPLIHTAEGEFFRQTFQMAFEELGVPVTRMVERQLPELAKAAFGGRALVVSARVQGWGKVWGPPWTKDHKNAALAAAMLLNEKAFRTKATAG